MNSTTSRRITVAEMAPHIHSFLPNENKVNKLTAWLIDWIESSLACGKIKPYDMLPSKGDLACHIGVSLGTIQNVFRNVEDAGFAESKQKIGTYVKNKNSEPKNIKLTSKRELAIELVKQYIVKNNYRVGDYLISTRKLAEELGITDTTVRLAVSYLAAAKILKKVKKAFVINNLPDDIRDIEQKTLVKKVSENLRKYIKENFNSGDKLPPNKELVKTFNVSLKTIHDAIKLLSKEGIVYTKRGRYGTNVIEDSIGLYDYEKIEQKIRLYISNVCNVGDKLPPIRELAEEYKTSEKTVKKALDNLAEDGYLTFERGRYGGTFVMDIPQASGESYKWLALNTDYTQN